MHNFPGTTSGAPVLVVRGFPLFLLALASLAPAQVLDPAGSWPNRELYMQRYRQLVARFIDNFRKFDGPEAREVEQAGPKL